MPNTKIPSPAESKHINISRIIKPGLLLMLVLLLLLPEPGIADTTVSGTISSDTTWILADSPYIVTTNITVQGTDGADGITTLTIEPGVQVRFNRNRYMAVGNSSGNPGALSAQGTAANPIVFTSNETTPAPGDWYGLRLYNTTDDATTSMEHCIIEYTGFSNNGAVYIFSAAPTLKNCEFRYSSFHDLNFAGTVGGTIENCTINNGIYLLTTSTIDFTGNTFIYKNTFPIKTLADNVHSLVNGNTFTNLDTASHLYVNSGNITKDATWTAAIPIFLNSNLIVQGTNGIDNLTTLTLAAGTKLKFNKNRYMNIGANSGNPGALVAQGTAADPIIFTSNQTTPAAGDWYGIRIYNTSDDTTTRLEHCVIEYTGYGNNGAVYIYNAAPVLQNCKFRYSSFHDLNFAGATGGTIKNCTINNGIYLLTANSVDFTGNTFNYNNSYPIKALADNVHSLVNGNTFTNLDAASHLYVNSGNITKDATWTAAIPIFINGNLIVQGTDGTDNLTTLTLAAGAKLKFNKNRYINIGANSGNPGALVAQGTAADPIVFTSNQTTPAAGDWYGIRIYNTSDDATTRLEHCVIEYAGYGNNGAVYIYNAAPVLQNCKFRYSSFHDLNFTGATGGTIKNCTINNGIYLLTASSVDFTGNTFNYNNTFPIKTLADNVHNLLNGNTFTNLDAASHLYVNSGNITKDATWTAAIPIFINGNLIVQGTDGTDNLTTLTLTAGAKLKFNKNRYMNIGANSGNPGALIAQGTADNMIKFTSNTATPAPGNWYGIRFYNTADDASSVLQHCVIEYAGYSNQGALYLNNAKPIVRNTLIHHNLDKGLYIYGTGCNDADIQYNTFTDNSYGIYTSGNALPVLQFNNFTGNTTHGLYNASAVTVIAENNWWGDANGPNQSGDSIYGNVDADPWSTKENQGSSVSTTPQVTFSTSPASILRGQTSTLSWSSIYADTVEINQNIGTVETSGTHAVSPIQTTTYTLTATGAGGTTTASATVTVNVPKPEVTLAADLQTIVAGNNATLSWSSTYADSVTIEPGLGNVDLNGSTIISPIQTTTYTLTAIGTGGTTTKTVTVNVNQAVTVSIAVDPASINRGQISTLTWNATNADTCVIEPGIGTVATSGSLAVTPVESTTYTITATSAGGTITESATVTVVVRVPPTISISAEPETIFLGQSTTISWNSTNAESASIDQGIGSVALSGSLTVSPTSTTTYNISVTGLDGTASAAVTINVNYYQPTVSFTVTPEIIMPGELATLTWNTTNANQCSIDQDIGNVPLSGSINVAPMVTKYYTLTAQGLGGTATAEVALTVPANPPTADASADPAAILFSESTLLTWNTTHADRCVIAPDIGEVELSGSISISPVATTTYTITAYGSGVSTVTDVDVTVRHPSLNIINTIAGTGREGYNGDNGPAVEAEIDEPVDMAMDGLGNFYIADMRNINIRKVDPKGTITTLAGNGSYGYSGDGGLAVQAEVVPRCIAADSKGNVYIGHQSNDGDGIRKVDTAGIITTISSDKAQAIALDSDDNLFALSGPQVLKIAPNGTATVVAGTGSYGYSGDGGPAVEAQLTAPVDIALDRDGNLYIAEGTNSGRVRKVNTNGIIITYAGGGSSQEDGIPATTAELERPNSIAVDPVGNLYILDGNSLVNKAIKKVDLQGTLTKVNGRDINLSLAANTIGDGRGFEQALLEYPKNIYINRRGDLFIAEHSRDVSSAHDCSRIRKVAPPSSFPVLFTTPLDGMTVFTSQVELSGTVQPGAQVHVNDIEATVEQDTFHVSIPLVEGTNLILAQASLNGDIIGTDAINLSYLPEFYGVIDSMVDLYSPGQKQVYECNGGAINLSLAAVAVDANGNSYFPMCNRIFKIDSNGLVFAVAGSGIQGYGGDGGMALDAKLDHPAGITVDGNGIIYIADKNNHRIRKVDQNGIISTVAGTGVSDWNGYAGPALEINLSSPNDVTLDSSGNLYIADTMHYRVLKMDPTGFCEFVTGQHDWISETAVTIGEYIKPRGVGIDASDNLYIADVGNDVVWRMDGGVRTIVAGTWCFNCDGGYSGDGGPATEARLSNPADVAVDAEGVIYIADSQNHRLRRVDNDGVITTMVGRPGLCMVGSYECPFNVYGGDGGPVQLAQLEYPSSIAVHADGTILVASNGRIRRISTTSLSTISGKIIDAATAIPIAGAFVSAQWHSATFTARTDTDGAFSFNNIQANQGVLEISIQAPSYMTRTEEHTLTNGTLSSPLQIGLYPKPELTLDLSLPLDGAVINTSSLTAAGTVSHTARVTINSDWGARVERNFSVNLPVAEGQNSIEVLAEDAYHQTTTIQRPVTGAYLEPVAEIQASATEILRGQSTILTWNTANGFNMQISPEIGPVGASGSITVSPNETTTYTLTVENPPNTATASVTVVVTQLEPVLLSAEPATINLGQTTTLIWSCRDDHAESVTIEPDIGEVTAIGTMDVSPKETTTYTITATGPKGTATANVTVTVNLVPPTVYLTAEPSTIQYMARTVLSWSVFNADTVTLSGFFGNQHPISSRTLSLSKTTTYTLTATGPGGTTSKSVTVTVIPAPKVNFSADPPQIVLGDSSTLNWNVTGADSISIDNGIGSVLPSGSLAISPQTTTIYQMTATGPGGTTYSNVSVTLMPPPEITFDVQPEVIHTGEQAKLTWYVRYGQNYSISPDIGTVYFSGFRMITPGQTTTYTLSADGIGGSSTSTATVRVVEPPKVTLTADPLIIDPGQTATLIWTSMDTDSCTLSPNIGEVPANGQMQVSPTQTTLYTLNAAGPLDNAAAYVRVYVRGDTGYGDPTSAEQAHIEAINRARANPAAEAARLSIDLNEGLIAGTISDNAVQPLACSAPLLEASRKHSQDMVDQQYIAHDSPNGVTPADRIQSAGFVYSLTGENISFLAEPAPLEEIDTILTCHDNLFIDADFDGRGHRLNIVKPEYREIGVGLSRGQYKNYPYAALLTCDFGTSAEQSNAYLLGVVFDDFNGDSLYSAGEGLCDVQMIIQETSAATLTASAGGYRIPLEPGSYTLKAVLPDGRQFTRSVTINDQNVKIDLALIPLPVTEFAADPVMFSPGDPVTLTWSTSDADSCQITPDVGSVELSGSVIVFPTTNTTYTLAATGPGGTATRSISLSQHPPAIEFNVSPQTLSQGQAATLTWNTVGATSCTIDQGVGTIPLRGTLDVYPAEMTTYTLTAEGEGGTTTRSVTVWFDDQAPTVVEITPANGSVVHTQNGQITITITTADDNAGVCGADLLDSNGQDVSHLLEISDNTIHWIMDANESIQYTLIIYDCAGNSITVPINYTFTITNVPPDVDYGIDADASAEFVSGGVRMTNGNLVESRSDIVLTTPNRLGLSFQAFYNSRSTKTTALGYGWSHTYSTRLTPAVTIDGQICTRIVDATGRARYFSSTSPRTGLFDEKTSLTYDGAYYIWYRLDGSRYGFNGDGQLIWMEDEIGNRLQLEYNADRLHMVSDIASSRTLTLNYDGEQLASISGPVTQAVPNGIWVVFSHDTNQNLQNVSYADGSDITYTYSDTNDSHNLTRKENSLGHLLAQWRYDSQDRVEYSSLADDSGVSLIYATANRVTVTDVYSITRTYRLRQILGRHKVIALEQGPATAPYSSSPAIRWAYDEQLNLKEVVFAGGTADSPMNTIHRFEDFDNRGNPATVIQAWNTPDERVVTFTYHPTLNSVLTRSQVSVLEPGQFKKTIYDYDDPAATGDNPNIYNENPGNLVQRIIEKGYTRSSGGSLEPYTYISTFSYNARGQVLSVDGPLDGSEDITENTYNPTTGDLTDITQPLIGTTTYGNHDATGQPTTIIDVNGVVRKITYDGRGRVTDIVNQSNGGHTMRIFDQGLLEQTVDADGITHTYEYDSEYGRVSTITNEMGDAQIFTYDNHGNRIGQFRRNAADPANYTSESWSFDHPVQPGLLYRAFTPNPEGNGDIYSEYDYNLAGNTSTITDPKGNITTYNYDTLNRVTEIIQPGGGSTIMGYDLHGNLNNVIDAENHQTVYEYDDMGRLVTKSSPDEGTTTYAYNAAGNLISSMDGRGVDISYTPDVLGRTRRIDYPAMAGRSAYSIIYDYDGGANGRGRLTAMSDASGSTTWDYSRFDNQGILTKTTTLDTTTYSVTKSVTPGGRITQMIYPSGRRVDYDRTACTCAISGVTTTLGSETVTLMANLEYRPFGVPKTLDIGDSGLPNVDNRFDSVGRLTTVNPDTPNERKYSYDTNGNTNKIELAAAPWQNQQFTYDALNRIKGAVGSYGMVDVNYDKVGNRLSYAENGFTGSYSYEPGSNRIERITRNYDNPITFNYDGHGNTTAIGDRTFEYNQANRLASVSESGSMIGQYVYNGLGQRVIKIAGDKITHFYYDLDDRMIAEIPNGSSTAEGKEYLYKGKSLLAQANTETGMIFTYHTNYLGAVHQLTDNNGTIVWEADYKPFGEATVNPGSIATNHWRLPGQYFDEETGLYYNYFRYYHPSIGRYLTPDPIGLEGGINLYAYVQNNPVNAIDPLGLSSVGKVVLRGVRGLRNFARVGMDDAVRTVRESDDIIANNRRLAREIAEAAGGGKRPTHHPVSKSKQREGYRGHYHPNGIEGSHIFYSIAGALTFSFYAQDADASTKALAYGLDLVNPLSMFQDILDIGEMLPTPSECGDSMMENEPLMFD